MRTKFLLIIISLTLTLSFLSGCGEAPTRKSITTGGEIESQLQNTEEDGKEENKNTGDKEDQDRALPTIDTTVLFEKDGLTMTAQELVEDPIWGIGIKVLIENDSDKNLGVQCNTLVVNNYMISDLFSSSVAAGKKANDTIHLSSLGLEAAGISTIAEIAISFNVFESDSYDTLWDTDEIELKTSAYGTVEQPIMDDGRELVNQDGIRIVGKYVEEDSFWGAGVLLYIENNYGENIIVQSDNMSINGFMVTPLFSCTVNDGRMALDDITIMSSDLETNSIESVDDIELTFTIINPDTYQSIIETDPIAFSTK
ncbi:MAG: hypothetical protein GX352_00300 [Clostridiales bacterium]|nr:hypothetical protein [Clostridiales bacterium]